MQLTFRRRAGLSLRTREAARLTLAGRRSGLRGLLPFFGPAIVASVAYIDPGNFATNIQGGASFGYELLWVVVLANLIAMLFQALSARLGIITGRNLAQLCRERLPRPLVAAMWLLSEVAAMATDLAELLGAAIGLSLLLGWPLLLSMIVAALGTYLCLSLERHGFRPLEIAISLLVGVIALSYLAELVIAPPDWRLVAWHAVVPMLRGPGALTLAVGIVGATVMPHALYLHSSLTQDRVQPRDAGERRRLVALSNLEVVLALSLAGLVNMAMLAMAARVFHDGTHDGVAEIDVAYRTLVPVLGAGAGLIFLVSLLASGFSSSVVGTMAGQVVMQGFLGVRVPLWLRRLVTMLPGVAVVAAGIDPTRALVLSQVVLSLVLPVPMVALVWFSSRPEVMGEERLAAWKQAGAWIATGLVTALNLLLLLQVAGLPIPFMAG